MKIKERGGLYGEVKTISRMLKSASVYNQKEVFEFVMKNKSSMPRTALRYAIEKMPANLKKAGNTYV